MFRKHHKRKHELPEGCRASKTCEVRTAELRDMHRHYRAAHKSWAKANNIPNEESACPKCGEPFTRNDNMNRHLKGDKCRRKS